MKILKTVRRQAFTLIEMIGVLAVIAILAALLIPKIFEAINNARINNACITLGTVKTALADHYAKYGSLLNANGVAITTVAVGAPYADFDGKALLAEGFIDKPFAVKIADAANADIQLAASEVAVGSAVNVAKTSYDLDGDGLDDIGASSTVVQAVMSNVTVADALELSKRLDGDAMSEPDTTKTDKKGRVVYDTPVSGLVTVKVYLTHR
jgi:prepilin-type N-terminal cleavage/methylation domain-containing protein